jgi:hypothetical protein
MGAVVRLDDVWEMLDHCAEGYAKKESREWWRIFYNGKTYPGFPVGKHGRRQNPEIESGHVRSMIRHLGVSIDCANEFLSLD